MLLHLDSPDLSVRRVKRSSKILRDRLRVGRRQRRTNTLSNTYTVMIYCVLHILHKIAVMLPMVTLVIDVSVRTHSCR